MCDTLLAVVLCISSEWSPVVFCLPSAKECNQRYEQALRFERNIWDYSAECRRQHEFAGSWTTKQRLMEAELWEVYARQQKEGWHAATYITWNRVQPHDRERYTPIVIQLWARQP